MDPVSMTLAAVGWLMSSLVDKAVTALLEAWAKRIDLEKEFKTLKEQLLQLGALLTSARGLRTNNSFLEELVQNLRQLAYRAENLLDELDYYRLEDEIQEDEIQHRGTQEKVISSNESSVASSSSGFRLANCSILSTLKGMSCCLAPDVLVQLPETFSSRINLSRRMKELVEQLQISEKKVRNALQTESLVITACNTKISQTEATNLRQTSSFLTEPIVFGRDQERDQLMNLLTNEESAKVGEIPVLAIVGTGGVGKTTLARLVFNDPNVHNYFEVKLWICVSTRFNIDRLTRDMLEGACGNRYRELSSLEELQKKLKDGLVSKRFLLVLDDMWEDRDKNQWDLMVAPLNYCRVKGSIILVTTRNQYVANMVDARDNIYLQGLDDNAFLSFFSTCIFNDPHYGGNWRFRNIGQQIANKLKGNPLAAKTVSALLKKKLDERYWMEIRDSEQWKSQNGLNDIMPALRLSYEHMPFHLQRCFSYCAIFPKDHLFTCEELVYLWMAHGFLDIRSKGKRMEDIGSGYFNDLFNRGFFQITDQSSTYGGKVYYTFHDLIHDLAHMVAFKECLTINDPKPRQIPPTIRHVSIFNGRETGEEAIISALACLEGGNLSTIINWDHESPSGIFQSISDLLKETKFLRALILFSREQPYNFNFQNFVGLRYLRLIVWNFDVRMTLPREICRLYHLEVFQIEGKLHELPNNFSDLVNLRHFIVGGEIDLHSMIWGVGKLTCLQELNHFIVRQKKGFEIEQLGSLKEIGGLLKISNLENVKSKEEASKARLAEKEKLDALVLKWSRNRNHGTEEENGSVLEGLKPNTNLKSLRIKGYGGVASPTWLEPSLIFLESLTLMNCKAWELHLPIGELEFLKHLKLTGLAAREIGSQCYGTRQNMIFPSLETLEITFMPYLEKWVWSDQLQLFLRLKKLTIMNCNKLVDLPFSGCATSEELKRFPSLESLIIEDCPLIFQLSPLPHISLLSCISIKRIGFIKLMDYTKERQQISLILDKCSSLKVGEVLAFHELSSLLRLEISNSSTLESLDLHSFVALKDLVIRDCQSLSSLTFGYKCSSLKVGEVLAFHGLSSLNHLEISNISGLESLDLHSFVALEDLVIRECQSLTSFTFGSKCLSLKVGEVHELSSLHRLEISNSSSLESLDLHSFVVLEDLVIRECQSLTSLTFGSKCSSLKMGEVHELSSLHRLEISNTSSLESLDLHPFVALENLVIRGCQSLTSLTFGEHLVSLKILEIIHCKTLSSIQGLKSWVNLKRLHFHECPCFIAAWDSASKEIESIEPDFSLSLTEIEGDSLALLTLPICKQLISLQYFYFKVSDFMEAHEVYLQFLTSIYLVDIRGARKNLHSFPFDLFPSLNELRIKFPHIESLPILSRTEIIEEYKKLTYIKDIDIDIHPAQIIFKVRGNDMPTTGCDAIN